MQLQLFSAAPGAARACSRHKRIYLSSHCPALRRWRTMQGVPSDCAPSMRQRPQRHPHGPPAAVAAWLGTLDELTSHVDPDTTAAAPVPASASPCQSVPDLPEGTLVHQRLSVHHARYIAPRVLRPQASQLLGLLFTLLGPPKFKPVVPGLRHPSSEGKYELLSLLWRHAEQRINNRLPSSSSSSSSAAAAAGRSCEGQQDEDEETRSRISTLVTSMTLHLRESFQRVLDNPLVPESAVETARSRLVEREASVHTGLCKWFNDCCERDDFAAVVLPLLRRVLGALEEEGGLEAALLDARGGTAGAAQGDAMEQRALQLVQQQLPQGWTLLSNAHVVALDGRHPGHHAACKWEVDLVALDGNGTAVALFEAKSAHANPLMTLLTDVERCLALVDQLAACSTATFRVKDETGAAASSGDATSFTAATGSAGAPEGTAAAAAASSRGFTPAAAPESANTANDCSGSSSGSSSSDEEEVVVEEVSSSDAAVLSERKQRKQRKAAGMKAKKQWVDVTVQVDPRLKPVYVLGRPLKRKDLLRGLTSCASAEALKLAYRDPAKLVATLGADSSGGSSVGWRGRASPGGGPVAGGSVLCFEQQQQAAGGGSKEDDALPDTPRSLESCPSSSSGSMSSGNGSSDEGVRLTMALPEEWREAISSITLHRLDLLVDRCTILAIDANERQLI